MLMKNATTAPTANRHEGEKAPRSRLTIQHRTIDSLRLDPRNPREHSQKQIAQIQFVAIWGNGWQRKPYKNIPRAVETRG
jgi:hypothetical protein